MEREVQREHGGEVSAGLGVATCHRHLDFHIVERVADQHLHGHTTAFRHVQFRRRKTNHHGAHATTRRGVLTQEIEGVLGVNVPLVLAFVPIRGTLAHVRLANQRVFSHGAFSNRPRTQGVHANDAHHVDDLTVLPQHDGVVPVEPRHRAQHLALVHDGRRSLWVSEHRHCARRQNPFEVERLNGHVRTVVVNLHDVRRQIDVKRRRIVHLQSLVVAGALHVFADDQIVTQARRAALQNQHLQGIRRQTVAPQGRCAAHGHAWRHRRCIQPVLVAQPPNVVRSGAFKTGKVEIGFVRRGQDVVVVVTHQKHVFAFHSIAVIPKRHQGAILRQASLCVGVSPSGQHGPAITRRDFARFTNQLHRNFCHADAPVPRNRRDGIKRSPIVCQNDVVRNGVHQERVIPKTFHVDCRAQEDLQHLPRGFIQHAQTGDRGGRIAQVGKTHDFRAQIGAKRRGRRIVEGQMSSFTRQHIGRARAQRLHHEGLVKGFTAVWHPRQTIGSRISAGFVDCFCDVGRHQGNQGGHLGMRDPNASVEHGVQHPSKRRRRPGFKCRCWRGGQHHGNNVVLPVGAFNQEEALVIQ